MSDGILKIPFVLMSLSQDDEEVHTVVLSVLATILVSYETRDTYNFKMIEAECWEMVLKYHPITHITLDGPVTDYDIDRRYKSLLASVLNKVEWVLEEYATDIRNLYDTTNICDVYSLDCESCLMFIIVANVI